MALSEYARGLKGDIRARYIQKIEPIGADPYTFENNSTDVRNFPSVSSTDIFCYLVLGTSFYTKEEFKALKSLDAYKSYQSGFVSALEAKKLGDCAVVCSKVKHSQRLRTPPANTWIYMKINGEVQSAHCDCIAGLGECCSHVGATLFAVEDVVRQYQCNQSVTDVQAYWCAPSSSLGSMARVSQVDYSGHADQSSKDFTDTVPEPTPEEQHEFLEMLQKEGQRPVIFKVTHPFNQLVKESNEKSLPKFLFNDSNIGKDLNALIELGKEIQIKVVDAQKIEESTRKQQGSRDWFMFREGRITASVFKLVCRTSVSKPSISLLKRICYPSTCRFKSEATEYGCKHEAQARKEYEEFIKATHANFVLRQSGLIIDCEYPQFGASPDGIVNCDCCGKGCLEIKCPFCSRDGNLVQEVLALKNSFLAATKQEGINKYSLSQDHAYYYQVQMQMALSGCDYCDFFAWCNNSYFYERILFHKRFWEENRSKALEFYEKVVFPEMLAKYFTMPK